MRLEGSGGLELASLTPAEAATLMPAVQRSSEVNSLCVDLATYERRATGNLYLD